MVLQLQFPLFHAPDLQALLCLRFDQSLDRHVEIAVFYLEFDDSTPNFGWCG